LSPQGTLYVPPFKGVVKNLILITAGVYLFQMISFLLPWKQLAGFTSWFYLDPSLIVESFYIWQPFTYQFLHGGITHLLLNMLVLWMFGSELQEKWGGRKFLYFYLGCGSATGLVIFLFNLNFAYTQPTLGASGAIYSLLAAYLLYWPDRYLLLMFIVPVKVKYVVLILAFISLLLLLGEQGFTRVSHIAHLGGFVVGYITVKYIFHDKTFLQWDFPIPKFYQRYKARRKMAEWETREFDMQTPVERERKVDELLDKISRKGIKGLTPSEKRYLKNASRYMDGEEPQKH